MIATYNENAVRKLRKLSASVLAGNNCNKRVKVLDVELAYICLVGIAAAFVGWTAENCVKLVSSGIIDSRFHLLPFISPYALTPLALHVFIGDTDDIAPFGKKLFRKNTPTNKFLSNVVSVLMISATVFVGEFAVGNAWELLLGVKLWDYSAQPLHFTQYVSVVSAFGYGTGAYLLFKFAIRPALEALKKNGDFLFAKRVSAPLGVTIIADTLFMILQIIVSGKAPQYWSIRFYF